MIWINYVFNDILRQNMKESFSCHYLFKHSSQFFFGIINLAPNKDVLLLPKKKIAGVVIF